ncbi:MAG: amidohydrolase [Armatimonadetes bacterium]|nr:amidohydrolase [Armatimonadota bacterium]
MVVDGHAHIIVQEATRGAGDESWRPHVRWEQGRQVVEAGGRQVRSALQEFVRIEAILQFQESRGIGRTILCPWVPLLGYELEPEEGLRASRIQNAALAWLVESYPGRVAALGAVPLQAPDLAARELDALMAGRRISGVEVAASVRGVPLGDDRFLEFWEVAEGTGALVFVHPTTRGFDLPALGGYYMWNTVGNPLETTIAAAQMVMAGMMERYPRLKVLLAHGGGALLSVRGRLRHSHSFQPDARARLRESPDASMRRFYYDTVTHDADLLRSLVDYVGADHVLLGSDYPFDMGVSDPVGDVHGLGLAADSEKAILGGNALRLLGEVDAGYA